MSRRMINRLRQSKKFNVLHTQTRERVARQKLRKAAMWISICGGTLLLVALATHLLMREIMRRAFYENPRYALKEIVVDPKGNLPHRQIEQAAGAVIGQNLMQIDLRQIQKNVERLPYVAEAQIQRELPGRLIIRVRERDPIAKMVTYRSDVAKYEWIYLDRDGIGMKPRAGEQIRALPAIIGCKLTDFEPGDRIDTVEVLAAVNLLKLMETTAIRVSLDITEIDVQQPIALRVMTAQGSQLRFRPERLDEQLRRLTEILDFAQEKQKQIASVDLTPERNVPVKFVN